MLLTLYNYTYIAIKQRLWKRNFIFHDANVYQQ